MENIQVASSLVFLYDVYIAWSACSFQNALERCSSESEVAGIEVFGPQTWVIFFFLHMASATDYHVIFRLFIEDKLISCYDNFQEL